MNAKFSILLVDDDPHLLDILCRAASRSFPEAIFSQIHSSTQAQAYLNQLDGYGPKLILLDIDLKQTETGLDFLVFLGAHPEGRLLPVIMLTVSSLGEDKAKAYSLGATSFTLKPFDFDGWVKYLAILRLYWFETVTLPGIRFGN